MLVLDENPDSDAVGGKQPWPDDMCPSNDAAGINDSPVLLIVLKVID